MKCLGILTHGLENIQEIEVDDLDDNLSSNDVLLKIDYFSLSKIDLEITEGFFTPSKDYPIKLGYEFCATVLQTKSTLFKNNDTVYGVLPINCPGASCQYIVVNQDCIYHKPKNLTKFEASSLPLSIISSYQSLTCFGENIKNKIVTINGSGNISYIACQIANIMGAKVNLISSPKRLEEFSNFKIEKIILSSKTEEILDTFSNSELIIDTACNLDIKSVAKYIKKASFVSLNLISNIEKSPITIKLNPKIKYIIFKPSSKHLQTACGFIEKWQIRPPKIQVYEFKNFKEAISKKNKLKIEKIVIKR